MQSNNLIPFAFDERMVRVLHRDDGTLLFAAKDVALALGYEWNGSARIAHVPDEWKMVTSVVTISGNKDTWFLTEQGLYFFLGRSDKPQALPFQKWLAGEVLPAIRRTGAYVMPGRDEPRPLPEAARRMRPALRERVLSLAVQTAKMSGSADPSLVDVFFAKYCRMVHDDYEDVSQPLPGVPLSGGENRPLIVRYIRECCLRVNGERRIHASKFYNHFLDWWMRHSEAAPPTQKGFGMVLSEFYPRRKRGGAFYYFNVAFNENI